MWRNQALTDFNRGASTMFMANWTYWDLEDTSVFNYTADVMDLIRSRPRPNVRPHKAILVSLAQMYFSEGVGIDQMVQDAYNLLTGPNHATPVDIITESVIAFRPEQLLQYTGGIYVPHTMNIMTDYLAQAIDDLPVPVYFLGENIGIYNEYVRLRSNPPHGHDSPPAPNNPPPGPSGSVQIGDILAVKKNGTSSTEVHVLAKSANYAAYILQTATALPKTDAAWQFLGGDYNKDGIPDLYSVNRQGTTKTDLHILNGAAQFKSFLLQTPTALGRVDQNFVFVSGDYNRDGRLDLWAIRKNSTKTEVHIMNGATNCTTYLLQIASVLHPTDATWDFHTGDWNGDGRMDLWAVKRNGGSGKTEVHILDGANGFQNFICQTATALHTTDSSWAFKVDDYNGDRRPDLYCIKKSPASSSHTELHILNGASNFQNFLLQTPTALPKTDANWEFR